MNQSFSNPILNQIEREIPAFGAALRQHQKREGISESELLASLRRCVIGAATGEDISIMPVLNRLSVRDEMWISSVISKQEG